jgi:hypothetical protein
MFVGDGTDPNACVPWLVLAVDPDKIVQIDGGKVKFSECEVVYNGDMAGAMYQTSQGRIAWVFTNSGGSASASGYSGSASASGASGSASASGVGCAAAVTGYESSLDLSPTSLAAVNAPAFNWTVRLGAIVLHRWQDGDRWPYKLLDSRKMRLKDGATVWIVKGKVQK